MGVIRGTLGAFLAPLIGGWLLLPGMSPANHERLQRAAVTEDGSPNYSDSTRPSLSADGRRVAFGTGGSLVAADQNYTEDIYVRDLDTGTSILVSAAPSGSGGNGPSSYPEISGDGRYVAFSSDASNLVPNDTNAVTDVFVRDLETGTLERVSVSSLGDEGNGFSWVSSITDDGRKIGFSSDASNFDAADTNAMVDAYVRDLDAGTTTLISISPDGDPSNEGAGEIALSGDGSTVAVASTSSNLVAGDTQTCPMRLPPPNCSDIFVRPLAGGSLKRITINTLGEQANGHSYSPTLSADGSRVAFTSSATNLDPTDDNHWFIADIFVAEVASGAIQRVTKAAGGGATDNSSYDPRISRDGTAVVFTTGATNIDPAWNGGLVIHDLATAVSFFPPIATDGTQGDRRPEHVQMSDDRRYLAFESAATDFPHSAQGQRDVYVYDRAPAPSELRPRPAHVHSYGPSMRVAVRAYLVEAGTEIGIPGRQVVFLAPGDVEICRVTTLKNGYAACAGQSAAHVAAVAGYRVVFAGDVQFLPTSNSTSDRTFAPLVPPCSGHYDLDQQLQNLGIHCSGRLL